MIWLWSSKQENALLSTADFVYYEQLILQLKSAYCPFFFLQDHIQEIFSTYGKIKTVEMPMDRLHPHLSRCSAYVEFETPEEAQKALKYMDGGRSECLFQYLILHSDRSVPFFYTEKNSNIIQPQCVKWWQKRAWKKRHNVRHFRSASSSIF